MNTVQETIIEERVEIGESSLAQKRLMEQFIDFMIIAKRVPSFLQYIFGYSRLVGSKGKTED